MKLGRAQKYLKGSEDDELFLKNARVEEKIVMEVYIDASYGVHADAKSHGGVMIPMGQGAVMAV